MNRKLIFDILKKNAEKKPNKILVYSKNGEQTYNQFLNEINCMASQILKSFSKDNKIIAIRINDNVQVTKLIFSLWLAGKTVLPLPKQIPFEKAIKIYSKIKPCAVITDFEYSFPSAFSIDKLQYSDSNLMPNLKYRDDDVLVILMTSGTTGDPKGCILTDNALISRFFHLIDVINFQEEDNYLFSANYSFDAAYCQLLGWVFSGGSLTILDESDSFLKIPEYLERYGVTHYLTSPSILTRIFTTIINNNKFLKLKHLLVGGEKFPLSIADMYRQNEVNFDLWNVYGPTEDSVGVTAYKIIKEQLKEIPIGKPLPNVIVEIMDENKNIIQKENTIGEIILAGEGLFSGYYKEPILTKRKMINIFGKEYYRTGDYGEKRSGNYYFCGRIDGQMKIHGVRVEAEEIEKNILTHINQVKNVVVKQINVKGKDILVAFYIIKTGLRVAPQEIQKKLIAHLEATLVPKLFIKIEDFPINKNGKIDNEKLEHLAVEYSENNPKSLKNEDDKIEIKLKRIWGKILKVKITSDSHFFLLGGDSLDSVIMLSEVADDIGYKIKLDQLYARPIFGEFLEFIKKGINEDLEKNDDFDFQWEKIGINLFQKDDEKIIYCSTLNELQLLEILNNQLSDHMQKVDNIIVDGNKAEMFNQHQISKFHKKFPLFSRQEFFLSKNFWGVNSVNINLEKPNYWKIILVWNAIIKEQQLLRCKIQQDQFVENVDMRMIFCNYLFIDEMHQSGNEVAKIERRIKKDIQNNAQNNLLYRISINRKSFKKGSTTLFISHLIADAF
ncbi:hypothetical protein SINU_06975, partial [Sporolactobacillus inulinus CASD]